MEKREGVGVGGQGVEGKGCRVFHLRDTNSLLIVRRGEGGGRGRLVEGRGESLGHVMGRSMAMIPPIYPERV